MLFADTYALFEIILGSENYKPYFDRELITTRLNLMELYYVLLKEKDAGVAERFFGFYLPLCVPVSDEVIKKAMYLKLRKRRLSYIDCIGYTLALRRGVKFLTGDKEFEDLPNVEFVK